MATQLTLPKLGLTMKKGKVVKWLKQEGDPVEKGELLYEVETEKIVNKIESPVSGILFQIVVPAGKEVPVGSPVAVIAAPGEQPARVEVVAAGPAPAATVAPAQEVPGVAAQAAPQEFVPSSPAARRLAKELGVDITQVPGTGPGGRVTEADVQKFHDEGPPLPKATPLAAAMAQEHGVDLSGVAATGDGGKITRDDVLRAMVQAASGAAAPAVGERPVVRVAVEGMRQAIASNMLASLQNASQLTLHSEVDVTRTLAAVQGLREAYEEDDRARFSLTHLLVMATARALKRFPYMNSTLVDGEILLHEAVNMGLAVALPEGLIVPVIHDADRKGLLEIAQEARELAARARDGSLDMDKITGGTFTITNLTRSVVDGFTPILRPPETGILGVGRVREKAVVRDGEICIRSMLTLSLTFDHGVIDGAPAAEFLGTLCRYLERPDTLLA